MARHCSDCGTRYSDGYCPNCHEEAFIRATQSEWLPEGFQFSDEFAALADQQEIDAADVTPTKPTGAQS